MKHGSLFSGIGGFDLAAKWMGWDNVFHCEIDDRCRRILKQHFPNSTSFSDIKLFDATQYRYAIDILSGGFPCQDISNAKTWTSNNDHIENGIAGKRSGLWFEYLRIIDECKPSFVVAENVQALTKKGLDIVIQSLSEIGYNAEWCNLSASFFGAPHARQRIWIVAYPNSIGRPQESIIFSEIFSKAFRYAPQWKFSRAICKTIGKKALPEHYGIHDGISRGLDDAQRMTAMGNAVAPQIPLAIFQAIATYKLQNPNQ